MDQAIADLSKPVDHPKAILAQLRADLENAELELPLLPATALRVFHIARDPDTDANTIAQLVQSDQKLAGEVLKVANSAAYSPRNPIVTLQQAVTRLGLGLISEISFAVSFRSAVYDSPRYQEQMEGYWKMSLTSALWGKEIARLGRRNVETQYLCGLFHNVGYPVALKLFEDATGPEVPPMSWHDVKWAVAELATEVGPLLCNLWKLPAAVQSVLTHMGPEYARADEYRDEVAGAWASRLLAEHLVDPEVRTEEELNEEPVFPSLNIYPDEMEKLLDKAEQIYLHVEAF